MTVEPDPSPAAPRHAPWHAVVLTLYPEMFPGPLGLSLAGTAAAAGIWQLSTVAIREFGIGRHLTVDDTPAGGGAGMVLRPDVVGAALDHARTGREGLVPIYLTPRGRPLAQSRVRELAQASGVLLLSGRFEGVDQRVIEGRGLEEISVGDYVLSGGELAAMVLIDACVRLLPGVIGAPESLEVESFETGLLEHSQFTRPREWEGRTIPDVLLSGNHAAIADWRRAEAERITSERRPDLLSARRSERRDR
jgi:tRNA (guanine37-N1)-methyltransferase